MKTIQIIRVIVLVLLFCIGLYRFEYRQKDDPKLYTFFGKEVRLVGVVDDEVIDKMTHQNVTIIVHKITPILDQKNDQIEDNKNSTQQQIKEQFLNNSKVVVTIQSHQKILYGDKIEVEGTLQKPQNFGAENGDGFDYQQYLAKDNIFYILTSKDVDIRSHNNGSMLKTWLLQIKEKFLNQISNLLPAPYSFLAGGLVIGGKGSLSTTLQDEFKKAGVIHMVVLSGYNVSIVGQLIMSVVSFLPPLFQYSFGVFGILCFAIMAGGSATIIRSVLMTFIALYAKATDHVSSPLQGLFIAGALMVIYNPLILLYDPSFQLSITATLGLILLSKRIEQRLMCVTDKLGLRFLLASCIAVQLFVTPLILHLSGMFSFVAIIVNVLVLPLIPLTMCVVFILGVVSFIHFYLATPFVFVSYILLSYELAVVHFFATLPFASTTISTLSWTKTIIIYMLYGFICWWYVSDLNECNPVQKIKNWNLKSQIKHNTHRGECCETDFLGYVFLKIKCFVSPRELCM